MYRGWSIAVIVPAHNEERFVGKVLEGIPDFVDHVVVVNDGSQDGTRGVVLGHVARDGRVELIDHPVNQGVGAAIMTGYSRALKLGAGATVVMAGDDQMDPAQLPHLLDPIVDGKADYTKGNRLTSGDLREMPRLRQRGNSALTLLTKLASGYYDVLDPQNGYAAISRAALAKLDFQRIFAGYGYCNSVLIQLNARGMRVLDISMPPRYGDEKSGIRLGPYILRLLRILFGGFWWRLFSKYARPRVHPILAFFLLAVILLLSGLTLGAYIVWARIATGSFAIGTELLASLLLTAGFQTAFLAMYFDSVTSAPGRDPGGRFPEDRAPLWRRVGSEYLGLYFHPVAILFFFGVATVILAAILAVVVAYGRLVVGTFSLGTAILVALLTIVGMQSLSFAFLFDLQFSRGAK